VDLSLPGMKGSSSLVVCARCFLQQQLYMIALTGYAGEAIRDACLAAGFDIHLVKPGEIDLLEELLGAERRVNGRRPDNASARELTSERSTVSGLPCAVTASSRQPRQRA
jgi:DNA-binding response OmpR family regulator